MTRRDGSPLDVASPYEAHLQVRYYRETAEEPRVPFVERIVFEDEHLLVADKPPFLPVTPSGSFVRECLLGRLTTRRDEPDLAPVHRLDRATSGLVIFSKRREDRGAYARRFAQGCVVKIYEAIAEIGADRHAERWTVESRIIPGSPFFRMREDPNAAEPNSRTEIERLEVRTVGHVDHGRFRLRPQTGKKHQLRVHMASSGLGILGDRFYPELLPEATDDFEAPLHLVATELRFDDPVTGVARHFISSYDVRSLPLPSDG